MALVIALHKSSTSKYGAHVVVDMWKEEAAKHLHVRAFTGWEEGEEIPCFECKALVITDTEKFFEVLKEIPREQFDKIYELCGLTTKEE